MKMEKEEDRTMEQLYVVSPVTFIMFISIVCHYTWLYFSMYAYVSLCPGFPVDPFTFPCACESSRYITSDPHASQ